MNKLILKLNSNVNLLKTGRNHLTQHALKVVYFAQIHSNLTYGIGVWGSLIPKESLKRLQKIQSTCKKILDNKGPATMHILIVEDQIKLELCKLWHKGTLGLLPANLELAMNTDHRNKSLKKIHQYNTRQKNLQNRPKSTQPQYHDSFLVKGNQIYSQLGKDLRDCRTMKQFNNSLKKTLLNKK